MAAARSALVTGAARGIGAAVARALADSGLAVAVTDRDGAEAERTAAAIRAAGGEAAAFPLDVTDQAGVATAVLEVEARLPPLWVLVNNAGWDRLEPFMENEPALWDRLIAINLRGAFSVTRAVLDGMTARRGGRIVNVSSDAGRVGSMGETVYAACKAGLIGFTKSLAREVARQGITVNAICPGPTETALLDQVRGSARGAKIMDAVRRAIPLGRFGQPEDVAAAVAYFASDGAEYVTGQVLSVSGGLTMAG
ncbi:MAG TPA: 3-oxoacyl-ACP reductase FabG [Candidatus Limnocylindria bacterium]|nr:3-oxoacyl-ACP reductase FabG [Candidatus Limnocylindria bacterium]